MIIYQTEITRRLNAIETRIDNLVDSVQRAFDMMQGNRYGRLTHTDAMVETAGPDDQPAAPCDGPGR